MYECSSTHDIFLLNHRFLKKTPWLFFFLSLSKKRKEKKKRKRKKLNKTKTRKEGLVTVAQDQRKISYILATVSYFLGITRG